MSASSFRSKCLLLGGVLWAGCAAALDPALEASQYGHTAWRIRDGFPKGSVVSFAQTPDGYLWLGTEFGLFRFDGVRATTWAPPRGAALPNRQVRALLPTRAGKLWIGTTRGLAVWDGRTLLTVPELDGSIIHALHEDRDGKVWVGASISNGGLLCTIDAGATECRGGDGTFAGSVASLYEQSNGSLWAAGGDRVWRLKPEPQKLYPAPGRIGGLQAMADTNAGEMIVVTTDGIYQIADGRVQPFAIPGIRGKIEVAAVLRDSHGALWIGTRSAGLLHVYGGRTDLFANADGLSSDHVVRLFEDREGNIWVSTLEGIDRFRALTAVKHAKRQGMQATMSVLAVSDGSIWMSTPSGLKRRHGNNFTQVDVRGLPEAPSASLFEDSRGRIWVGSRLGLGYIERGVYTSIGGVPVGFIESLAEDKDGNMWVAHRESGLLRVSPDRRVEMPWENKGLAVGRLAADPVRGGIWIGSFSGDLIHFMNGGIAASYSARDGLGNGAINHVSVAADGAVWAATEGGLSRIKDRRIATLDSGHGMPCDYVDWMIQDAEQDWWLYTACGLVRVARSELDRWIAAADAGKAPPRIAPTVLDASEGMRGAGGMSTMSPHAARSADGKLWFTSYEAITMVDPRRLHVNMQAPPVHIEGIIVDRKAHELVAGARLPPLVRDLAIEYTATSLVAPEKLQFKYKLEGRDQDWNDAGNRRQAFYTDLEPGNYRFRVIASNNSGVWNEEGASLEFSVAPAYWQTWWFRAVCAVALAVLLWELYRLRMRQMARQFNMTLDARVNERMRIARELHDTLLQSFHGLLLRFQTAFDLLPSRATEAKQVLASAIDQAAEAITEGRDAVQGLRSSVIENDDLAGAIRTLGEDLAANTGGHKVLLRVEVQGAPRTLHPIMRDEIFRIAGEAMRNAFQHAEAKRVEVELYYDEQRLRLRARDDGKGIDQTVLDQGGREGHFGMPGMRERAKLIGGKLAVWSGPNSGTEIELTIPASRAYAASETRVDEKIYDQSTASER